MPNVIPGTVPGIATATSGYPQYGIGGTLGSSAGWEIVTASSSLAKSGYIAKGYDVWFKTRAAAQSFIGSEVNPAESGGEGAGLPDPFGIVKDIAGYLDPLNIVKEIFGFLTQKSIWLRGAEITAGLMLVYLGLKSSMSGTPAGNVAKGAGRIAETPLRQAMKIGGGSGKPAKGTSKTGGKVTSGTAAKAARAGVE